MSECSWSLSAWLGRGKGQHLSLRSGLGLAGCQQVVAVHVAQRQLALAHPGYGSLARMMFRRTAMSVLSFVSCQLVGNARPSSNPCVHACSATRQIIHSRFASHPTLSLLLQHFLLLHAQPFFSVVSCPSLSLILCVPSSLFHPSCCPFLLSHPPLSISLPVLLLLRRFQASWTLDNPHLDLAALSHSPVLSSFSVHVRLLRVPCCTPSEAF